MVTGDLNGPSKAMDSEVAQVERVVDELKALDQSSISPRDLDRRTREVLRRLELTDAMFSGIARAANAFSPGVRNAIASVVPPSFKQAVYGAGQPLSLTEDTQNVELPTLTPESLGEDSPVVLLLGSKTPDMVSNLKHLQSSGFAPRVASTVGELTSIDSSGICGIVVLQDVWGAARGEHRSILRQVVGFSCFASLFINSTSLEPSLASEIEIEIRRVRHREPSSDDIYVSDRDRLRAHDIDRFRRRARCLVNGSGLSFVHAGVGAELSPLLSATIRSRIESRMPEWSHDLEQVACAEMHGGQTGSLLFILKPGKLHAPFVVKIGERDKLTKEIERFDKFIVSGYRNGELPQFYFERHRAAIIFPLVEDPDEPDKPAAHSRCGSIAWPSSKDGLAKTLRVERGTSLPWKIS